MKPDIVAEITAINLQRIWWIVLLSTVVNLAILSFNLMFLQSGSFALWQIVDASVSLGILVIMRRLRSPQTPLAWKQTFVGLFLIVVLAFMDNYFFILLHSHGPTAAYVLGVVTLGVLILVPPRVFIPILLVNHAIYCALVIASVPAPAFEILNGSCTVFVSALAGWFLYHAKIVDLSQRRVIAERNLELQRGNEEMAEVMAITAHDLRSPLQGVKHLLDFAAPPGEPGKLSAALQMASASCGEMIALIGRLLDAHATGPRGELTEGDLRPHFALAAERARTLAEAKNVRLDLRPPEEDARAMFSAGALAQVLDNLLGNAIKFSPPGSTVTLRLFRGDGNWCAEICDEGPGVAAEDRENIFEKFRGTRQQESGSGLGLFIVRKCMDSLNGSVRCEPAERGAVFRLEFDSGS